MTASAQAKEMVQNAKTSLAEDAKTQAEAVQESVAQDSQAVADAARAAADELDTLSPLDSILEQAGARFEQFSDELRNRSIPDLVDDVSTFARRNPLIFLGGAALAGFAAARFLGATQQTHAPDTDDVWAGHLDEGHTSQERP